MKNAKKFISILLITVLIASMIPALILSAADGTVRTSKDNPSLVLWYDEETQYGNEDLAYGASQTPNDEGDGWERWSLPIGNGYFGANVFGRTFSERVQLSEKTLWNPYSSSNNTGGLNNFSETYIDFEHPFESVDNYKRSLNIDEALASVEYTYDGVEYKREYFTSYVDNCMVIKLTASEAGALSFTLRPTIPYLQDFVRNGGAADGKITSTVTKHGNVTSSVSESGNVITLKGNMGHYNIDFIAEYRVFTDGNVAEGSWTHTYNTFVGYGGEGDNPDSLPAVNDEYNSGIRDFENQTLTVTNGTLNISDASEAYVVVCLNTNYKQDGGADNAILIGGNGFNKEGSEACAQDAAATNANNMASALDISFAKSGASLSEAYETLKERHKEDYTSLYDRVDFNLEYETEDLELTTDKLLEKYISGEGNGHYLEMLYYQYGRYLLISSSREKTLPANLQGVWNRYNFTPWSGGYWHNINVQMNYWHAFSTNLAECFEAYVNYEQSYFNRAKYNAETVLEDTKYPFGLSLEREEAGISIGIGGTPFKLDNSASCGELGFTTQMFWDYYEYTRDEDFLRDIAYPLLYEAAEFITKTVAYNESEDAYLSMYSYSAEQKVGNSFYYTEGTTYSQSFAYLNNRHLLEAAELLGIADDELITEVKRQIDKYDAILVGYSGQIKEFREENYYGEIGEWEHRHISQLVGLFPGEMINSETPAWLDAAEVTLNERGVGVRGWSDAHKIALFARTKNGERAHDLYESLLKTFTSTNLWNLQYPYQIDGNFGGTAGVTEMLLQSHEDYIEPLAAIPESWADGSYNGLCARGGFSLDAIWADGSLTNLTLHSSLGGKAKLKVQSVANATVLCSDGSAVSFTNEGEDYITLNTEAGKSYTVTNIPKKVTVAPAEKLTVTQTSENGFKLDWNASPDAVSYNVYKAVSDSPDYTLIASTVKTAFNYETSSDEENARMTYRVCAINADGRESVGVLDYINPDETEINAASAIKLGDGSLQVLINALGDVKLFSLYEYDEAAFEWVKVCESEYPVLIYGSYDSSKRYAAGATANYFAGKLLEIKEVGVVGSAGELVEDTASNAFIGADIEYISDGSDGYATVDQNSSYPLSYALDNNMTTRFGPKSTYNSRYSVTVTLPFACNLKTLKLYTFHSCSVEESTSEKTFVEVYSNGGWTTLHGGSDGFNLTNTKVSTNVYVTELDMGFTKAEKVRITFTNTDTSGTTAVNGTSPKNTTSIWEITSTYAKVGGVDRSALLSRISELESADLSIYNKVAQLLIKNELEKAKTVLADINATADDMTAALAALDSVIESADGYKPTVGTFDVDSQTDATGAFNKENFVEIVDGVYGNKTKVYKWTFDSNLKQAYSTYGNRSNANADVWAIEFDVLVEEGALWRLGFQGYTGSKNAYIMNLYFGGGAIKTDGKDSAISGGSSKFDSAGSTLCEMENNKWYRVAVVLPANVGTAHNTMYVYVNGVKYTLTTDTAYHYGKGYIRFLSDSGTCYLDNIRYTSSAIPIYDPTLDTAVVPVGAYGAATAADGEILVHKNVYTVSELESILGESISVISGGKVLADTATVSVGDTVLILPSVNSNAYTYYTVGDHKYTLAEGGVGYCDSYTCEGCGKFYLDFTPRMSLTLDSNLIFNIYVPKLDSVKSVTVDGKSYELSDLPEKDGYYKVSIPLAAKEAGKNLTMSVRLNHSSGRLVGEYSFSLAKYAKLLLDGTASDVEKTLIMNVLAYVNSAYSYFGGAENNELSALLGDYSAAFEPTSSKSSCPGLSEATFVLGDTPSVRFYLDGSYARESFTFKQNDKTLTYKTGSDAFGNYVEISLYAYAMTETFTYTVAGTDLYGEYNLASYCAFVKDKYSGADRDNLLDLCQKFYIYCQSAGEYRAEVLASQGG
ncbi:MAG: glycoside hydrolase N-terminal domain-containing protein [Clostridia bacterium]|nr:glycoside hydrolase N-terminal domain-containing protein [Clostridia bacterium]